jgi:hypothetical protein
VSEYLWVAELIISPWVWAKLCDPDHRLDPDEVRLAIVAVQGLRFKERSNPPRGPRSYVQIAVGGVRVLCALYPVEHPMGDVYALGSAYPEPRGLDAVR